MVDKRYCMSSFLMLRTIFDRNKSFSEKIKPHFFEMNADRNPVKNSTELENELKKQVEAACKNGKAALALSGGIDSAILAKFMPKNSMTYTFKSIVPGIDVIDESPMAKKYAEECGLNNKTIEIYWEDYEKYAPILMAHKGAPIHSIEVQIYKASLEMKKDGFDTVIFGESADANFGGLDGLLSKNWTVPQFIDRFSNVMPYKAVKDSEIIEKPFEMYSKDGYIEPHDFIRNIFYVESMGSYEFATSAAGINLSAPYSKTFMGVPIDYNRIRSGEGKYLVREVFKKYYPNYGIPPKTPMPRPMDEWLKDWKGPIREEFWPHCTDEMTGDQKWLVWSLERFLNLIDEL